MTNNQSNELRDMLLEAMGDFPTDHILQYHIDKFEAYCKERERQARIQAIDDVKNMWQFEVSGYLSKYGADF